MGELRDYLKERYFEQLVPIVFGEDDSLYYDIIIDLLEMIYRFPMFGSMFHDHPQQFDNILQYLIV